MYFQKQDLTLNNEQKLISIKQDQTKPNITEQVDYFVYHQIKKKCNFRKNDCNGMKI